MLLNFIDEHRKVHGVGPVCKILQIASSTYYEHKANQNDPSRRSLKARRDDFLKDEIKRVWNENFMVYGARKIWRQLNREGIPVARCTVERLMRNLGLRGAIRGKRIRTTIPAKESDRPLDLVKREFAASRPNQLWVSDFTYVSTWKGFVYVAFVIDVFSRMIVGWRVATSMTVDLTLDALEQALWVRHVKAGLIHHSDRGSQYLAIKYSERLAEAGIDPSVGSQGDAYDNAMAESVIGLFKTEVIRPRGPWKNFDAVEYAVLEWVDWFNNRRLLEPIGNIPPVEFEKAYYNELEVQAASVGLT